MNGRGALYKPINKVFAVNPINDVGSIVERQIQKNLEIEWVEETVDTTKDPKVFGPPLWFSIHNFSAHYPTEPNERCRENAMAFIKAIPYLIPCKDCFIHAQHYISKYSLDDLKEITKTRAKLFKWTVDFHNYVNNRLGKPIMNERDAYNLYHSPTIRIIKYGKK